MNAKQVAKNHPELHAWFLKGESKWAREMMNNLRRYDRLSDKQLEVSLRIKEQDDMERANAYARAANSFERADKRAASIDQIERPKLEIAAVEVAFDAARDKGIKTPKMRLARFTFKAAGAHSANPGAIYITDSEDGKKYLGKVLGGVFSRSRECTDELEKEIQDVCADPKQAAIAYGKKYGICCICSRTLTDPHSIEMGIGPICADNFGW